MWFIGLILGGIIGAIGDERGAVIGALFGAGIGWAISQKLKAPREDRFVTLEASLRILQERVTSLEAAIRAPAPVISGPAENIRTADAGGGVSEGPAKTATSEVSPMPAADSLESAPAGEEQAPDRFQPELERAI